MSFRTASAFSETSSSRFSASASSRSSPATSKVLLSSNAFSGEPVFPTFCPPRSNSLLILSKIPNGFHPLLINCRHRKAGRLCPPWPSFLEAGLATRNLPSKQFPARMHYFLHCNERGNEYYNPERVF